MKKFLLVLVMFSGLLWAGDLPSVKDFGAKGDGKTDDTAALQKAVDAVTKKLSTYASATLYFPKGRYKISRKIVLSKIHLKGDSAVIVQTDPKEDIFYYTFAWNTRVSGLEFQGGRNQLSMWNRNTEKGMLTVRDCRFFRGSGIAVGTRLGTNSTIFTVSNCVFYQCGQAVVSNCDWTSIREVWITSHPKMRKQAVIVNGHGVMTVDNMLGVPLCNGDKQRWIDNYGSLFVTSSRFGGEGGGFTPVYNYAKYKAFNIPTQVSIVRSWIAASSSGEAKCAVYCIEVPNMITIRDCTGGGAAVVTAPGIDLNNYFYAKPETLLYEVSNVGNGANLMPAGLKKIKVHPVRPDNQLTAAQTLEAAKKAQPPAGEGVRPDIDLQTAPGCVWRLDNYMDGGILLNSEFLHIVRSGKRIGLMRRVPGSKVGDWPHVEIQNVKVDIRKYPILSIDPVSDEPARFAVKITVPGKKTIYQVTRRHMPLAKKDFNLLETFPELAKFQNITVKVYYIPSTYRAPAPNQRPVISWAKAGSSLWFKTIGFNKKVK